MVEEKSHRGNVFKYMNQMNGGEKEQNLQAGSGVTDSCLLVSKTVQGSYGEQGRQKLTMLLLHLMTDAS